MAFAKLPEALQEPFTVAAGKIGAERAVIALQAVVHSRRPLRLIDGVLRPETLNAVAHAVAQEGAETIRDEFIAKIETRFPGTFSPEPEEDESPAVAPRPRTRRP